jgi:hypothetical protein
MSILRLLSESTLKDLLGLIIRPQMTAEYRYTPSRH